MRKRRPFVSHEAEQVKDFKKNPKRAMEYLNACVQVAFEENDPELMLSALALMAKAYGMTRLARDTHLQRESLHRMLSEHGNPEWNSLFRVFKALRLRPRLEYTDLVAA